MTLTGLRPVLFAYDGSDIAGLAIEEAARQISAERDALVLTVWEPFDVEFLPIQGRRLNAASSDEVGGAAEEVARQGAKVAGVAGFRAQGITTQATPPWRGIVDVAEDRNASLIVLGSHGRTSLASVLIGSVARSVSEHSDRSLLIVHRPRPVANTRHHLHALAAG
jgi:nucleotide-binding universal stress UspA family protein